jgi:hypothetical protein
MTPASRLAFLESRRLEAIRTFEKATRWRRGQGPARRALVKATCACLAADIETARRQPRIAGRFAPKDCDTSPGLFEATP